MFGMAKSKAKPDSKRTLGIDRHAKPRVVFHLDEPLLARLKRFLEATRPTPGTSEVCRFALDEFLTSRGFPEDADQSAG